MSFNGSGTFTRLYSWVQDALNGIKISSTRMDAEMDGFATGLSTCVTKDGQTTPTANLPMGSFVHTVVGNATLRNQYSAYGQVQDGSATYAGTVGGTGDAITITLAPVPAAYAAGQRFTFIASAANTTATTVNVNSLGVKSITKNGSTALAANDIPGAGAIVDIEYDGTRFQLGTPKTLASYSGALGNAIFTSLTSSNADPADAGALRLGNAELIEWEANPTGTDLTAGMDANNVFSASVPINATTGFRIGNAAATGKFLVGNGTNYVASTSTVPTSAGATANKVLLSDGTNYVLSTPTFPNASATSGKFIRSDGTNWVASTPTLPTSAGTAGKVLRSDGTNYIESTPTIANTAASGHVLRGDGTNWLDTQLDFADLANANPVSVQAYRPLNNQTGTTYTLALTDNGKMVTLSNASAITLTIPANASVAFPVGSEIDIFQLGAGQVTVAITSDTLNSYTTKVKLAGQYAGGTLKKLTSTSWALIGNLA